MRFDGPQDKHGRPKFAVWNVMLPHFPIFSHLEMVILGFDVGASEVSVLNQKASLSRQEEDAVEEAVVP